MRNCLFVVAFTLTTLTFAGLKSPFKSTVKEISINNTHYVDSSKRILRGMAPLGKISELKKFGITDILIFKNQTKSEIDQELAEVASLFNPYIKQIDFLWHDYPSYQLACDQIIDGLKFLKEVLSKKTHKAFFHCTVGEDRTGALAGLWRILTQKWSIRRAFKKELCERGYERGNGNKPFYVINEIRQDLTPLFLYMAKLIKDKKLTLDHLNYQYCKDEIGDQKKLKCDISSKFLKK